MENPTIEVLKGRKVVENGWFLEEDFEGLKDGWKQTGGFEGALLL